MYAQKKISSIKILIDQYGTPLERKDSYISRDIVRFVLILFWLVLFWVYSFSFESFLNLFIWAIHKFTVSDLVVRAREWKRKVKSIVPRDLLKQSITFQTIEGTSSLTTSNDQLQLNSKSPHMYIYIYIYIYTMIIKYW